MRKDGTEFVAEANEGASSIAYRQQLNSDSSPSEAVSANYRWTSGTELARPLAKAA